MAKLAQPKLTRAKNKKWEDLLAFHLRTHELGSHFQREVKWHPTRKWRFDFADVRNKVAIEVQGGTFTAGKSGHNWGPQIMKDHEKYNQAQYHGWVVFQFTDRPIRDLSAINLVMAYYQQKRLIKPV